MHYDMCMIVSIPKSVYPLHVHMKSLWLQHHLMTLFPVLVKVYRKEQLVTKEEAEKATTDEWKWEDVAATKNGATATRIADILDEYGFSDVARQIRGKCMCMCFHLCV